jgi:hypothetical protein
MRSRYSFATFALVAALLALTQVRFTFRLFSIELFFIVISQDKGLIQGS